MHLHVGVLHAFGIFATIIALGFFWRVAAMVMAQSDNETVQDIGQAMAFIY